MKNHDARHFWHSASQRLRRRINAGFIFQLFLPVLLALTVLQGCLLLIWRKTESPQGFLWLGYVLAAVLALATCIAWARRRFFSAADALVHLEAHLSLHNRLTAARAGHASWPDPRPLPPSLRWSWKRLLLPPLAAGAFLLLAGWMPLADRPAPALPPADEPVAWQEVETWAEVLEEREMFEEEPLAQWKEQVQTLRDQPAEDWYSHSSLEAGDNLRDQAADSLRHLQGALEKAAYPLSVARESLNELPTGLQPLLQEHWQEALSDLQAGALTLNKETLAQLKEVDFNNLQSLSPEQIDRLKKMLREGKSACDTALGEACKNPGEPCGTCPGGVCQGPGTGTPSRGPGAADLTFREFPNLIDSQRREAVSNQDLSRAALGEQLGTTQTAPEVDPNLERGPVAAGSATLTSQGGEAVFHSRLTPAEQRRLQEYFR